MDGVIKVYLYKNIHYYVYFCVNTPINKNIFIHQGYLLNHYFVSTLQR
ncbi:Uncharacterised protein [Escherichia coli]|nr:Uncharacterised protein [Escherichia coli]